MSSSHDPTNLGAPIQTSSTSSTVNTDTRHGPRAGAPNSNGSSAAPQLHHTRTAPTTLPVHGAGVGHRDHALSPIHDRDEDGSSTPHGVAHENRQLGRDSEKEEQHAHAEKAGATLGVSSAGASAYGRNRSSTLDEKSTGFTRIGRTSTGTQIPRQGKAGARRDSIQGFGMAPIVRQPSLPPAVGPFGGAAPSGIDAEEGLWAVRSHEEELERQKTMDKKGPDPFAVKFVPGDKENPKNWGIKYRWWLTGLAGLLVLNSTFASSAPSGVVTDMQLQFGFSREVAVLTIALFVAGYMLGPLLWGPLSEIVGRRPVFIVTFIAYIGFQVGCALAPNTAAILVFRFLGGTFAAAPLTNSGAIIADIWEGDHRGQAMSLFALAPFAGPAFGPIVAGYISVSGTSWRWVFWVTTIFASVCLLLIIFAIPETYAPALLVRKAQRVRQETGDDRYYAPAEKTSRNMREFLNAILLKPFIMLALEPMLLATTLYMSYIYGIVYLLFEAFPFVFVENHGFNAGENGLCFLGFFTGGVICVLFFVTVIEPRYLKYAHKLAPQMPQPEKRLELCIISAWTLVIAMFWFGWTSYSSIHWISPVLAGALIGFSVLGMFVSLFNYVIDTYLWSAASALAGMTVVRSAFGAGFPLFASQMYEKLGTQWASSLLGFLALVMAPIPMVLLVFGAKLRARSKYSPNVH